MATIDQCNNCAKEDSLESKEGVLISSKENYEIEDIKRTLTPDYLKENTKIRGWLSFFLFSMTLGGLISAIFNYVNYNPNNVESNIYLELGDLILGIMVFALACYAVYAFTERRPNAVYLAKLYIIVIFVFNLFPMLVGGFEESGIGSVPQILRSIIWCGVWFAFILFSDNIKEVIPKVYRKIGRIDYYITAVFILVPLFFMAFGIRSMFVDRTEKEAKFMQNVTLSLDEYTDGKIVFERPTGFVCEKQETEGIVYYSLEDDGVASITLVSDYDTDMSAKHVLSCSDAWRDEDLFSYPNEEIGSVKREVNNHPYFIREFRFDFEDNYAVYWRFVLMFDTMTGKVCLLSCYDGGDDSYLLPLLSSIRFQ